MPKPPLEHELKESQSVYVMRFYSYALSGLGKLGKLQEIV